MTATGKLPAGPGRRGCRCSLIDRPGPARPAMLLSHLLAPWPNPGYGRRPAVGLTLVPYNPQAVGPVPQAPPISASGRHLAPMV